MTISFPTSSVERHSDAFSQLGDREPSSRLESQAVIEHIRAEKGYLEQDVLQDLEALKTENREYLLRLVEQKKQTETAYTTSISEQLYSSKYQFLYKVIQNADDSHYHRTAGRSSKKESSTEDYTGEKGFGFKSVFSVAERVHVQSGLWSIRFELREGQDGLGMVTPLDAPAEHISADAITRITLELSSDAEDNYPSLLEAIADIQSTTLLFLRKLSILSVEITHPNAQIETVTIEKIIPPGGTPVEIKRSRTMDGTPQFEVSLFHHIKHVVEGMPADSRRKGKSKAPIDLAFPVNPETLQTKLSEKGEHIFAYLPVQRLPQLPVSLFIAASDKAHGSRKSLIQADFMTSANRENIIDCNWNETLCKGVALAFAMAIEIFFATDHTLRYSWLDYLPSPHMEKPWKSLYVNIIDILKTKPVLQT